MTMCLWLINVWGGMRARPRLAVLLCLLAIVVLSILVLSCIPSQRAFVVAAETYSVSVTTQAGAPRAWRLINATVCNRREEPLQLTGNGKPSDCDERLYTVDQPRMLEFEWPIGKSFTFRRPPGSGSIAIEIQSELRLAGETLRSGSRILIPNDDWAKMGALMISGQVGIGAIPPAGASGYTLSGHYEVREALVWRSSPVVVAEGDLMPGDRVEIVGAAAAPDHASEPDKPAFVQGFISANPESDSDGFQVLLYSAAGHDFLRLDRMAAQSAFIGSAWYDKALKDPWLITLTAALTFTCLVLELVLNIVELSPEPKSRQENSGAGIGFAPRPAKAGRNRFP